MYKIKSPYEAVENLVSKEENHYKTNLHTHSTYSDANNTMADMIFTFYDLDFDILAFAEHGILGKEWDKEPSIIPLFRFQYLWHGKRRYLTTEEYRSILSGTYKTAKNSRTKKRGLMCVPDTIEANMFTLMKNHVNGYFTNDVLEGKYGKENDFEVPIATIEKSGGISHINHPTDWLGAYRDPSVAKVPENVAYFADLFRRYKSCVGMEVLNMYDRPNRSDRILWDELLKTLIPEGERTVWGFGNSDAHRVTEIDTAFMDFILPEYSLENLRRAMENGNFFAVARYAKNELGEDFAGKGAWPKVMDLKVDDENDTITIKGINCKAIEWIADGEIIQSETISENGEMVSTIKLADHSDKISCYVRAQLKGDGGICMTQPFICDDGNMARFRKEIPAPKVLTKAEERKRNFDNTRLGVIVNKIKNK
ncbi:MAG: hypothetical protein E7547_03180 [Ruminococcaceae bacterium]|nr:hypothetical protein [Oscillospiraceae bacterium]